MLFKYDIQEDLQNTEGLNGDEQVLVITDTHTRALIRPTDYPTLVLRAGEAHKNLHSVEYGTFCTPTKRLAKVCWCA